MRNYPGNQAWSQWIQWCERDSQQTLLPADYTRFSGDEYIDGRGGGEHSVGLTRYSARYCLGPKSK